MKPVRPVPVAVHGKKNQSSRCNQHLFLPSLQQPHFSSVPGVGLYLLTASSNVPLISGYAAVKLASSLTFQVVGLSGTFAIAAPLSRSNTPPGKYSDVRYAYSGTFGLLMALKQAQSIGQTRSIRSALFVESSHHVHVSGD